ncbi:hypothetical protein HELRODRAFT_169057 [Helobdella robusta]|uniref:Uncharacterized protein n=1 Tax=Helobdella robusta TaxID=6412 RepID=T1F1C1_HELRO|nr:hypothetical protein HELRODRAFT_169057 [Helobdella robusta]ESO09116.1 hypothetical protein HELRODRAFT_169057 [Helobdella robusta]
MEDGQRRTMTIKKITESAMERMEALFKPIENLKKIGFIHDEMTNTRTIRAQRRSLGTRWNAWRLFSNPYQTSKRSDSSATERLIRGLYKPKILVNHYKAALVKGLQLADPPSPQSLPGLTTVLRPSAQQTYVPTQVPKKKKPKSIQGSNNSSSCPKSAGAITKKKIYFVSNHDNSVTCDRLTVYIKSCKANVLSCFEAKSRFGKGFRVCVVS